MSASVQDKPCRRCEASGEFGAQCGDLKVEGDIVRVLGSCLGDQHQGAAGQGARFGIAPKAHAKLQQLPQGVGHPSLSETFGR